MRYTKCKIAGCNGLGLLKENGKRYFIKGYCRHHYHNLRLYGDPLTQKIASKGENRVKNRTYHIWQHMKDRCYNPNATRYDRYGGRGIKISPRWLENGGRGYANFLKDMGEAPDGCSIDRIDPNGDYTPDNCRWANKWVQAGNKERKSNTGVVGVHYNPQRRHYVAAIQEFGKTSAKCFKTLEEAIAQRKQWEKRYGICE